MKWKKARKSGPAGNCYVVARPSDDLILLADSKQQDLGDDQPNIPFTEAGWEDIVDRITDGYLDLGRYTMPIGSPVRFKEAVCERTAPGTFVWRSLAPDVDTVLTFTIEEHDAFLDGVENGEFDMDELEVEGSVLASLGEPAPGHEAP